MDKFKRFLTQKYYKFKVDSLKYCYVFASNATKYIFFALTISASSLVDSKDDQ